MEQNQYYQPGYTEVPQDYKIWSIVNIVLSVLCCGCCGIIGLVFAIMALLKSNDVEKNLSMGEPGLPAAQEASSKAKTFNIISTALVALSFISNLIYFFVYGLSFLSEL